MTGRSASVVCRIFGSVRGRSGFSLQDTVNCVNLALVAALLAPSPVLARDSLGVFDNWGAFRDPGVPRCYAIARAERRAGSRAASTGYATVGIWPRAQVRGQLHFHLSRSLPREARITVRVASTIVPLVGGGDSAWAPDQRGDAALIAAMRSAERMTVRVRSRFGGFVDSYSLAGVATAIDAALVGCANG